MKVEVDVLGSLVRNSPYGLYGHKSTLNLNMNSKASACYEKRQKEAFVERNGVTRSWRRLKIYNWKMPPPPPPPRLPATHLFSHSTTDSYHPASEIRSIDSETILTPSERRLKIYNWKMPTPPHPPPARPPLPSPHLTPIPPPTVIIRHLKFEV